VSLLTPLLRRPFTVLAALEALAFAFAFSCANARHLTLSLHPLLEVASYAGLIGLSEFAMGLYSRRLRAKFYGVLLRAVVGITGGSIGVAILSFCQLVPAISPVTLLLAWLMSVLALACLRRAFEQIIDESFFKRPILVLGAGKNATAIANLRRRVDRRGFLVHGYVPYPGELNTAAVAPLVNPGSDLLSYCRAHGIEEVIVALDDKRRDFPLQSLLDVRMSGIPVIELMHFLERETGTVRLDVLHPSWLIFAPGFNQSAWRALSSRSFDVLMSSGLLLVAAIPMLLTVLAIKLTEGLKAPLMYRQLRVGYEGRHFDVLKFRSMRTDAEAFGAVWATKNDPRITAVGRFMRKTRVDELPQIFNVLLGDMSFVGPRPERPQFVETFEQRIPYYRERHAVKPGITGWAQLCYAYGASEEDAFYKLQYDLYYIKNRSLLFDFSILLQTIEVVLWGKGR
jgi:sugar transferase (PEP-CTERM system associated)